MTFRIRPNARRQEHRRKPLTRTFLLAASVVALAGPALADPCEASVNGFQPGATFAGQVRYVGDGDSICVGPGTDPRTWIEVRLANWFAPELNELGGREAKAAMESVATGKPAVCTVQRGRGGRTYSYDRVIATCSINGKDLSALLRGIGASEGGRGR